MIPFKRYLVWQCFHCGAWQGRENKKWSPELTEYGKAFCIKRIQLKCIRCNKSTKFKDGIGIGA